MPVTRTQTLYTLAELKELFPAGYAAVVKRWADHMREHGDNPWAQELLDSLTAVVSACGGKLLRWQMSTNGVDISVSTYTSAIDTHTDFMQSVLRPRGYLNADGAPHFSGLCAFTGYCADDDFLEHINKQMAAGNTLWFALESLDTIILQHLQDDMEQQCSAESCEANTPDDALFLEDGRPA